MKRRGKSSTLLIWFAAFLLIRLPAIAADGTDLCRAARTTRVVCEAANQRALEIMKSGELEAITVVQDVRSGRLLAFAASKPETLDVTTPLLPLSTVKLMLAASWWEHETASSSDDDAQLLTEMLVNGNDDAGRKIASRLRRAVGADVVVKDLERYGFPVGQPSPAKDLGFWSEVPPPWKEKLTPAKSFHSLGKETSKGVWEDALSIGEANFIVTALHLSRFLQAVGNEGILVPPSARSDASPNESSPDSRRIMTKTTALKLQHEMRGAVERGTAKSAASILAPIGWQMGGKTGTGPGPNPPGPTSDGWFAGLIFDPQGVARFTVATFVRHGGLGGGNAARLSAELARFLIGADSSS